MTIAEIVATYGEDYFRDGERRVIARLMQQPRGNRPSVIATGGGAFVNEETRALILATGIAVWLDSDVDTLMSRVGRNDKRPLLKNGNPRDILMRLRNEREPCYRQAPIHVKSGDGPHSRTLEKVLRGINEWL